MPDGYLNTPANSSGLFAGFDPAYQVEMQKAAAARAFVNGVPTDAAGSTDYGAMSKTAFQNGDFANGGAFAQLAFQQRQLADASKLSSGMMSWLSPASSGPPTAPQSSTAPSASQGAMPVFLNALASVESKGSGDYSALGPTTDSGDRAYGKFQVMGANVGPWTKEVLGQSMTPEQFLANPQAQDAVAAAKFGQYLRQTGTPQGAASMWFTGRASAPDAQDRLGTTGAAYVQKFMAALPRSGQLSGASPAPRQVAQNGADDASDDPAPAGTGTHPYAPAAPATQPPASAAAPQVASNLGAPPPMPIAPAPIPATGPNASPSRPAPMPTTFASPPPPSPNAGALTPPGDPTYGGQVPIAWLQAGHSAADWVRYQRTMAGIAAANPYAKGQADQWAKAAEDLQTSMNKQAELTPAQKDARDPAVVAQQNNIATIRARARVDAQTAASMVPVAQPDGSVTMMRKSDALALAASGNGPVQSLPGYVTSGQQALATKLNDGSAAYTERQVAGERLDALSNLLSTYQTGANSTAFGNAVANLRSIGISVPDSAMANPAAMQEFTKNAYANVLASMKEQGNKQYAAEVQSAVNSNPNAELQPEANAAMIAQMKGIQQYHDANFRDYANWYQTNKGASNDAQFQIQWAKANPLGPYIAAAAKDIAPMGVPLPPPDKLVDGQAYMVQGPSGQVKARWNAAVKHFVPVGQ